MRNFGKTWIVKVLMGLLVLSFGLWGIADIFRGFGQSDVASVGGTEIPITVFQESYNREVRNLQNQLGTVVNENTARALGLPDRVLQQLIAEAAMQEEAKDLNLGISREMLIELIARDPTFQTNGKFDRNRFLGLLASNNLTEPAYVAAQRSLEMRKQVAAAVNGGLALPAAYADAVHNYSSEERSIQYLMLGAAQAGDVGTPGDTELNTFYDANKAQWRAPEYRALTLVTLSPADLSKPADVSDDQVKEYFEENKASYGSPETRHLRQIVFPSQPEADAASARLKAGETFDAVMQSRNLRPNDVELGTITKDKVLDPLVAEAAFALAPNTTSDVVAGRFGPTIVSVTEVNPATQKTLEEVRDEIRNAIALRQAAADVATMRDAIEDARAGGETLSEIAQKNKLTLRTVPAVDAKGNGSDEKPITDLPGGQKLLTAAFESDIGIENDPIPIDNNGMLWFEVTDVKAEHDRPLAEVRDRVVEAWKKDATAKKLEEKANAIADRVRGGTTLDSIGDEMSLTVESAQTLKRGTEPKDNITASMITAAFIGPEGSVNVTTGKDDPSRVVLKVTSVTLPPTKADGDAQVVSQIRESLGDDLFAQYIAGLQTQLGVKINQSSLNQAIASGS
jgi:peptidyl-prolyl cis-trans isomerase D